MQRCMLSDVCTSGTTSADVHRGGVHPTRCDHVSGLCRRQDDLQNRGDADGAGDQRRVKPCESEVLPAQHRPRGCGGQDDGDYPCAQHLAPARGGASARGERTCIAACIVREYALAHAGGLLSSHPPPFLKARSRTVPRSAWYISEPAAPS